MTERFVIDAGWHSDGPDWSVWRGEVGQAVQVFSGTALECIAYCEEHGATRKGPRLFVKD